MKGLTIRSVIVSLILFSGLFLDSAFSSEHGFIEVTRVADEIYKETYHFHFRKVDLLILANDSYYNKNLTYNLAVVNYYWWRLISGEQNRKYSTLVSNRIEKIAGEYSKRDNSIEHEQLFMLISIYAYNARVNLVDNYYFAALSDLSKYYSFIKRSFGYEATYNPFYLTSGLYLFFSGLAKEKAPLLVPFLSHFNPGNKETGLEYLIKATSSTDWKIRQEAQYFLMKIYFDVYKNYAESARYCRSLLAMYPENLLFQQYMFRISLAVGQVANAKARITMMERTAQNNSELTSDERMYYTREAKKELNEYILKKK